MVLLWFCFFLPAKNIVQFNFQSLNEMTRKFSQGGLCSPASPGNKQSQTPVRELSQSLVAITCPVQLFFGPQLVLRPILGQFSKFVTVLICAAITFFTRAHGKTICMHLGAESTDSKIKQNSAGEADNTQMPTYNKMCINCALTGAHQHSPAAFCLQ